MLVAVLSGLAAICTIGVYVMFLSVVLMLSLTLADRIAGSKHSSISFLSGRCNIKFHSAFQCDFEC